MQSAEPDKVLKAIIRDQETLELKRLSELQETKLAAQSKLENRLPMPVKVYEDSFNETLQNSVISKAINQTGNVATQFWLKHFEKKCKH